MASKGDSNMIPQHKRMAVGQKVGFLKGGRVTPTGAGAMVPKPSGPSCSPISTAKRNNGIPGMKTGGVVKGAPAVKGVRGSRRDE